METLKKLLHYELYKAFTDRFFLAAFALLLLINGVTCWFHIRSVKKDQIPTSAVRAIFEAYEADPDAVAREYEERQEFQKKQSEMMRKAFEEGTDFEFEELPNRYAPDGWSDDQLFRVLWQQEGYADAYRERVDLIMKQFAEKLRGYDRMGVSQKSFSYRYQLRIRPIYDRLPGMIDFPTEYPYGWQTYFSFESVNLFIFLTIMIGITTLFTQELSSGFITVLRTTRGGRAKTAASKLIASGILCCTSVLLFTVTTFALVGISLGYSDPNVPLQLLSDFILCPFLLSVREYVFLSFFFRLFSFLTFSVIIAAISVFVKNTVAAFACELALYGIQFIFRTTQYMNADHILKNCNLIAATEGNAFFERYRAINLFGHVGDYLPFFAVLFSVLILVLSFLVIRRYGSYYAVRMRAPKKLRIRLPKKIAVSKKPYRPRTHSLSVFRAEMFKLLVPSGIFLLIIALFGVKLYMSSRDLTAPKQYTDKVILEYMTTLAGPASEEKTAYLARERQWINETIAKSDPMQADYFNGVITVDEYKDYLREYGNAFSRRDGFSYIDNHMMYQTLMRERGYDVWFVYPTGWSRLLRPEFDYTMYAALLLLFAGYFAMEHNGKSSSAGFAQLLRSTKYGRRRSRLSKYGNAALFSFVIAALWNLCDLYFLVTRFELPLLSAPVQSLQFMQTFKPHITIGTYLVCFYAARLLFAVLLGVTVTSLSGLLKKSLPVIAAAVVLTLTPKILSFFRVDVLSAADYTQALCATPLLLRNSAAYLFAGIVLLLSAALFFCVRHAWEK